MGIWSQHVTEMGNPGRTFKSGLHSLALPGSGTPPPPPPETPRTHPKGCLSLTPPWCLLPGGPPLSPCLLDAQGRPDCTSNFPPTHPCVLSLWLLSLRRLLPAPSPLLSLPSVCFPVLCLTHTRVSPNVYRYHLPREGSRPQLASKALRTTRGGPPLCPRPPHLVGVGLPLRPRTAPLGSPAESLMGEGQGRHCRESN